MSDETTAEFAKQAPEMIKTILQEGVDFDITVDRPALLHRWKILPAAHTFKVMPAKLGTLLAITKIVLTMSEIKTDEDSDLFTVGLASIAENKDKMVRVLALGIMNRPITGIIPRIKYWWMLRFIDRNITPGDMLGLIQLVIVQMDVTRFLACSVSIKRLNLAGAGSTKQTEQTTGKSSED